MNRIILIGNGFDLAHGLKTSYADFIDWYWNKRVSKLKTELTNANSDILCTLEINPEHYKTWNTYFYFHGHELTSLTGEEIVSGFSKVKTHFRVTKSDFFSRILHSYHEKGWVDIENEYYRLLFPPAGNGPFPYLNKPKTLNAELLFIRSLLIEYLNTIEKDIDKCQVKDVLKEKMCEPFKEFDTSIEGLKQKGVEMEFLQARMKKRSFSPERILLLNFNYTTLADRYLSKVNHIHGKLSDPDSVIFGYGDELNSDYKLLLEKNDNEYLRNVKSIKYLESPNYRQLLEFVESDYYQIYIMGHSCGNSDRTLLNTLFEHKNCVSIKPFYHKWDDGTDNHLELVQNISRNFTDMKLMRDRVVNKTFCETL